MKCAKNKCHARPTANKFSGLWNTCNGIFNFVWWGSNEKFLQESLLHMLAEQRIRCFQTTENNVVKCKSKSISLDRYCSCRQPCFSKDAIVENKQMAECGSSWKWFYRMCERCLKRSLRMKVLNGIACSS